MGRQKGVRQKNKGLHKSLRTKLILIFLVTTLLTSITSMFVLRTSDKLMEKMEEMFRANAEIKDFLNIMEDVDEHLVNYLVTDDSDSVLSYYINKEILEEKANKLFNDIPGIYTEKDLIYKDIVYMVRSYIKETDEAVKARRVNDADEYIARYAEANKIVGYINDYSQRVNLSSLEINTMQYLSISDDLNRLILMNNILIFSVIILNLIIILYVTYNLTQPITDIATAAEAISNGDFETGDIAVASEDELYIMANAFNEMKKNIKNNIIELQDKVETEQKLYQQKIENLKMKSLLDDAELKALQMQINPHFLFNTLNAGVQLAMMEEAEKTSVFLEDISTIFRYNVKSLDRVVTLKEEIQTIQAYTNMFKVRFGETIQFNYNVDEEVLDTDVPPLIIQPLVENATIHGLGNKEEGGKIDIIVKKENGVIRISVIDDGVGMKPEIYKSFSNDWTIHSESKGHTTGIGITNVVQRMRLFLGVDDVIEVESELGKAPVFHCS